MTKKFLIPSALVLTVSGAAFAGFDGFSGVVTEYDDGFGGTWDVINVYADFSDDSFGTLNVFNAEIFSSDAGGFNHNDLADATGGSWKPSFSFSIPGAYDPMRDSYVTIGYGVGALAALNQTALDPGFGTGSGGFIPTNAGWFNLTPDDAQYASGGQLHVGQFVMAADREADFTFEAEIGYNTGAGTEVAFGEGIFTTVPAPGALALIGLGGLCARRRRA